MIPGPSFYARFHSMKIVLATPLYPPDTALPALYIKELARRLSTTHEVSIVAYTHLPEQIPAVRVTAVSKRQPVPIRLLRFAFALLTEAREAEHVYALNGPSVELPLLLVSLFTRTPFTLILGDTPAYERSMGSGLYAVIHRLLRSRAHRVIDALPLPRPEVLPFEEPPSTKEYETSWKEHLKHFSV